MKRLRVLVAEDNKDHRYLTIRAVRAAGTGLDLEVEGVEDGASALDYVFQRGDFADRERPNLILLDLRMPKVDGLQVLEQIKSDDQVRSIPVVVLTSSDREEDVEAAYRLGTNSYVTKATGGLAQRLEEVSTYWTSLSALPSVS